MRGLAGMAIGRVYGEQGVAARQTGETPVSPSTNQLHSRATV